uniref:Uncharacterized protein n=1 Tax=Fagus sylvatica TaxID=28930 RepID=A0A2N9G0P0_FAGSY
MTTMKRSNPKFRRGLGTNGNSNSNGNGNNNDSDRFSSEVRVLSCVDYTIPYVQPGAIFIDDYPKCKRDGVQMRLQMVILMGLIWVPLQWPIPLLTMIPTSIHIHSRRKRGHLDQIWKKPCLARGVTLCPVNRFPIDFSIQPFAKLEEKNPDFLESCPDICLVEEVLSLRSKCCGP